MQYDRIPFDFVNIMDVTLTIALQKKPEAAKLELLTQKYVSNNHYFGCFPGCYSCCETTILMSGHEYRIIAHHIARAWNKESLFDLFAYKLGRINKENYLVCPFLNLANPEKHCEIYEVRPWICRVFGTTAVPCNLIPPNLRLRVPPEIHEQSSTFFNTYFLRLDKDICLASAPFEGWCIADSSKRNARWLLNSIVNRQYGLEAILVNLVTRETYDYRIQSFE